MEEKKFSNGNIHRVTVIHITAALVAAVWLGLKIPTGISSLDLTVSSPFSDGISLKAAAMMCLPDLISAAVLSVSMGGILTSSAEFCIFAVRGLALGLCISFCTANSVTGSAVGAEISFGGATLLLAAYALYMRSNEERMSAPYKMICYLTVSGALVVIRALPYLFV